MFSSENFIISGLTFTLIPFDLIFVYGVMYSSKIVLGERPCGCPMIPVPFVEKSILSPLSCFAPLSGISCPYRCNVFLDSLFRSLYLSYFYVDTTVCWLPTLYKQSWSIIQICSSFSNLFCLFLFFVLVYKF